MLLDESTALDYLRSRGVEVSGHETVRELTGGVSNVALAVTGGPRDLVVKQALARLRVADEWLAPVERIDAEAAALRLAAEVAPHAVPPVIDFDGDRHVVSLDHAPADWVDWKTRMMRAEWIPRVAEGIGSALARWHALDPGAIPEQITGQADAFESLRLDPYHRTVAARLPEVADALAHVIASLQLRQTLVHGDLSPKNVLVGPHAQFWVIDWEVAHLGNPVFDQAFLLSHLLLKHLHVPELRRVLPGAGAGFLDAYVTAGGRATADGPALSRHIGALLLARVAGKSQAGYLEQHERLTVSRAGIALLTGPELDVPAAFDLILSTHDEESR